jgi:hypothetical protein
MQMDLFEINLVDIGYWIAPLSMAILRLAQYRTKGLQSDNMLSKITERNTECWMGDIANIFCYDVSHYFFLLSVVT